MDKKNIRVAQENWEASRGVILDNLQVLGDRKESDWTRFDEIFSYKDIYDLLMGLNIK